MVMAEVGLGTLHPRLLMIGTLNLHIKSVTCQEVHTRLTAMTAVHSLEDTKIRCPTEPVAEQVLFLDLAIVLAGSRQDQEGGQETVSTLHWI